MTSRKRAQRVIPFHEVASIFPLMEGDEFKALTEDIRRNGLREAIWTYEGKIVDGRNRYSACLRLQEQGHKIEPAFREWDGKGSLVAFVVSLNLHRRHLSESQRAVIAAELAKGQRGGDRKSEKIKGAIAPLKQEAAAELLNVSRESVKRASKVLKDGDTELVSAVKSGAVSVSAAAQTVDTAAQCPPQIARMVTRANDRAAIAENLSRLPDAERARKIELVVKGDQDTLAALANKPPMPKKQPPSARNLWQDFFDDTNRTLKRLGGSFEKYYREWDYDDRDWLLDRLRDLTATLNDVEATALRSVDDDDERAEGTTGKAAFH